MDTISSSTTVVSPKLSSDEEEVRNENGNTSNVESSTTTTGISSCPAIIIGILSLLRIATGAFIILSVLDIEMLLGDLSLGDQALPLILIAEVLEFLYYLCFGRSRGPSRTTTIGPRGDCGMNVIVFLAFCIAFAVTIVSGLFQFNMKLWPMFIYVVLGNILEAILVLLFQHKKVNGQVVVVYLGNANNNNNGDGHPVNVTLGISKIFVAVANSILIVVIDYYYELEKDAEDILAALLWASGILYILHGITLCSGLVKYYYY